MLDGAVHIGQILGVTFATRLPLQHLELQDRPAGRRAGMWT